MFKTIVTLFRGRIAAADEALADSNALALLDQQMRDVTAVLGRARRALAVALAQQQAEDARTGETRRRITDLEDRAREALQAGQKALAVEAAEAIAALEGEDQAGRAAQQAFAAEIARLRRIVARADARLAELDRGRRLARTAEAVRQISRDRLHSAPVHETTLREAEATLARLRTSQVEDAAAEEELDTLEAARRPEALAERMGEAGFGPPARPRAADVLARLRAGIEVRPVPQG